VQLHARLDHEPRVNVVDFQRLLEDMPLVNQQAKGHFNSDPQLRDVEVVVRVVRRRGFVNEVNIEEARMYIVTTNIVAEGEICDVCAEFDLLKATLSETLPGELKQ